MINSPHITDCSGWTWTLGISR